MLRRRKKCGIIIHLVVIDIQKRVNYDYNKCLRIDIFIDIKHIELNNLAHLIIYSLISHIQSNVSKMIVLCRASKYRFSMIVFFLWKEQQFICILKINLNFLYFMLYSKIILSTMKILLLWFEGYAFILFYIL